MLDFKNIRSLIIDMDGVLWHGDQPLPGLTELFQVLRSKPLRFILATNNASYTRQQYVKKFERLGIEVSEDEILTSGIATALYLAEHYDAKTTKIYVVGEEGASQPIRERGFTLTGLYEINADVVVVGKDQNLTWDKLATATLNIRAGAKFIGTNGDTTLPTERGIIHGNGAILAALHAATSVAPICIGKPEPIIYQHAIASLGGNLEHTIAIGDRLETDILGAINTGIRSVMVLTGVSTKEDLRTSEYQPTWVLRDIRDITTAIKDLNGCTI